MIEIGIQAMLKQQKNPDGKSGHFERERIRQLEHTAKPEHFIPGHNRRLVIDEVEFTSTIVISEVKECPSYARGCTITGCIKCKKREWDLFCKLAFRK